MATPELNTFAKITLQARTEGMRAFVTVKKNLEELNVKAKETRSVFTKLTSKLQSGGQALKQFYGPIAVTSILAGFTALTSTAIGLGNQFKDMSDKTGVSAQSLASWVQSANVAGVSTEALEKGLLNLQRNIVSSIKPVTDLSTGQKLLAQNTSASSEVFKKWGIEIIDTNGKLRSTEEVFLDVTDKISGLEKSAQNTADIMKVLGARSGPRLVPLLEDGSKAINRYADAIGPDFAENADIFLERLAKGKEQINILLLVLVDKALPIILKLEDKIADLAKWIGRITTKIGEFGRSVGETIENVSNKIQGFIDIFSNIDNRIQNFLEYGVWEIWGKTVNNTLGVIINSVDNLGSSFNNVLGIINNVGRSFSKALKPIGQLGNVLGISNLNIPQFARGGVVNNDTLARIGENGPEAVVPLEGGRSIPVTIKGATGASRGQSGGFLGFGGTGLGMLGGGLVGTLEHTLSLIESIKKGTQDLIHKFGELGHKMGTGFSNTLEFFGHGIIRVVEETGLLSAAIKIGLLSAAISLRKEIFSGIGKAIDFLDKNMGRMVTLTNSLRKGFKDLPNQFNKAKEGATGLTGAFNVLKNSTIFLTTQLSKKLSGALKFIDTKLEGSIPYYNKYKEFVLDLSNDVIKLGRALSKKLNGALTFINNKLSQNEQWLRFIDVLRNVRENLLKLTRSLKNSFNNTMKTVKGVLESNIPLYTQLKDAISNASSSTLDYINNLTNLELNFNRFIPKVDQIVNTLRNKLEILRGIRTEASNIDKILNKVNKAGGIGFTEKYNPRPREDFNKNIFGDLGNIDQRTYGMLSALMVALPYEATKAENTLREAQDKRLTVYRDLITVVTDASGKYQANIDKLRNLNIVYSKQKDIIKEIITNKHPQIVQQTTKLLTGQKEVIKNVNAEVIKNNTVNQRSVNVKKKVVDVASQEIKEIKLLNQAKIIQNKVTEDNIKKTAKQTRANKDLTNSMKKVRVEAKKVPGQLQVMSKELGNTITRTKKFGGGLKGLISGVVSLASKIPGLGLIISGFMAIQFTRTIIRWKKEVIEWASELGKVSQKVKVSSTAIRELRNEANLADISFSEVETSLRHYTSTLARAQSGNKTYVKAFEDLNISLRDNDNRLKTNTKVLEEISYQLVNSSDKAKAFAAADKLLGKQILSILPVLNKYGGEIEEIGMKFDGQAESARKLDNQWNILKSTYKDVWRSMVLEITPALNQTTNGFINATNAMLDFFGSTNLSGDYLIRKLAEVNLELDKIESKRNKDFFDLRAIQNFSDDIEDYARKLGISQDRLNNLLEISKNSGQDYTVLLREAIESQNRLNERSKRGLDIIKGRTTETKEVKEVQDSITQSSSETLEVIEETHGVYNNILMRLTDISNLKKKEAESDVQVFMNHASRIERLYNEEYKKIGEQMILEKKLDQDRLDSIRMIHEAQQKSMEELAEYNKELANEQIEINKKLGQEAGNTISQIILGTKTWKNVLMDIAQRVIPRIIDKLFEAVTVQKQASSGGFWSNVIGGIGSLFGFEKGGIMTPNGPLPLKKYRTGGIASSPQLAMYGEGSRAEAYVPLPDNRRIPVKLEGSNSGIYNTINISINNDNTSSNVQTRSAEEDRIMAQRFSKLIDNRLKTTIINERRPGGILAR